MKRMFKWFVVFNVVSLAGLILFESKDLLIASFSTNGTDRTALAERTSESSLETNLFNPTVSNSDADQILSDRMYRLPQSECDNIAKAIPHKKKLAAAKKKKSKNVWYGIASWYGSGLHGERTASGDIFDMNEFTAAHRTLPFGTKLKITNRRTKQSVVVTVTDRGPLSHSREIDLSKAAADKIGLTRAGVAKMKIEKVL